MTAEQVILGHRRTDGAAFRHDVHGEALLPAADHTIHVPSPQEHVSAGRYYSTLFHELTHSTGPGPSMIFRIRAATDGAARKTGSPVIRGSR
jgi:antirestriction protein ArdC